MESNDKLSLSVKNLVHTNEVTIVEEMGKLKKSGKSAIPVLIDALKEEGSLRNIAATVLGEFGSEAREAAGELSRLLKSDEEDTRMAAALSLMRIGKASIPYVVDIAKENEGPSRFWASWCLAWINPSLIDQRMYECLKNEQEHPSGVVAPVAAEEALGKIIAFQLKEKED